MDEIRNTKGRSSKKIVGIFNKVSPIGSRMETSIYSKNFISSKILSKKLKEKNTKLILAKLIKNTKVKYLWNFLIINFLN